MCRLRNSNRRVAYPGARRRHEDGRLLLRSNAKRLRTEWQTLKRLCHQNLINVYDFGEFERESNTLPVSTRSLCQSHRSLCLTNHTFNFQYPLSGAFWTFCSPSSRLSAVPIMSGRFRSCAAKSSSPTTTSPVG